MLVISFATINTPYISVINQYLLPSLKTLNIPYDISYPEDKGTWQLNTQLKPTVIKEMLLKHKQAIVYLDSDATIEYYPELFDKLQDYDIGVHCFDWMKFWRNKEGDPKREFLGGTLYFNYNEKVLAFVDEWINITKDKYNDQQTLNIIVPQWKDRLNIYPIPIEYIAIRKTVKVPDYIINPCIIHNQASRRFRSYKKK